MTSTHKPPKRNTAVLAIIFLLPALYIFAVWINVFQQDITTEQKVTEFTEKFLHLWQIIKRYFTSRWLPAWQL